MKTSPKFLSAAAALALLAGCGSGDRGAGGLTPEEDRALDNAAGMLDQNNIDVSADSMVANESAIAAEENAAEGTESGGGNAQ